MIKYIKNENFAQLSTLFSEMWMKLPEKKNPAESIYLLVNDMVSKKDFRAFGYFNEEGKLLGFVTGFDKGSKMFYFSGIYMPRNSKKLKELVEFCFDEVKKAGYAYWQADCTNDSIASVIAKYNAVPTHIRYTKYIGED